MQTMSHPIIRQFSLPQVRYLSGVDTRHKWGIAVEIGHRPLPLLGESKR